MSALDTVYLLRWYPCTYKHYSGDYSRITKIFP